MTITAETLQLFYKAMFVKDQRFEGVFFTAVKTTGIFCRPICRARKPKKTNIEFFATAAGAVAVGYRACKVSHPLSDADQKPAEIVWILAELEKDVSNKLTDSDLMKSEIEPNRVRRWFRKNYGMSFHAFQREIRLRSAFGRIMDGESVTTVAFDSGYESLSGFSHSFKNLFGVAPS